MKKNKCIVIISPVRNEAQFLRGTIRSIVNQSLLPVEWIFVDDGSIDNTAEIIKDTAGKYPWIRYIHKPDRGSRSVGPGVVDAFYYGYFKIKTKEWDYILKLDGDIELPPSYFETLLSYFEKDTYLGSASGKVFIRKRNRLIEEHIRDEMVSGAVNFYRNKAFDSIGGFVREVMWDGIAIHRSRMAGWRTRSIRDSRLNILHKRIMGSSQTSLIHGRARWGRGQYFMGTHPLYIFATGLFRMLEKPFVIGGLSIIFGYFKAMYNNHPQHNENNFRRSLHAWQFEKLRFGKRLEKTPVAPRGLYPA